jgi:hypothetical protein
MLARLAFLPFALLTTALPVRAQAAAAPGADALKPYEFLIGAWAAEGEFPGASRYTLERSYRPVLNGKFLQSVELITVGGQVIATEMWLGYDPGKQAVSAWGFSSDSSYSMATGAPPRGDTMVMEGRLVGGPEPGLVRSTMKREGNDRFTQLVEVQKGGAWAPHATLRFARRASPGPAASPQPLAATQGAEPLRPLTLLAGAWRTEGESDGVKYAVEYGFHWTLSGHFLRSEYSVTTGTQTELHAVSMIGYDPETKALMQWGFSADGAVITAMVRATADSVVTEGEMVSATRRTPVRITYSRPDADTLSTKTEMQRQGAWRSTGIGLLRRK